MEDLDDGLKRELFNLIPPPRRVRTKPAAAGRPPPAAAVLIPQGQVQVQAQAPAAAILVPRRARTPPGRPSSFGPRRDRPCSAAGSNRPRAIPPAAAGRGRTPPWSAVLVRAPPRPYLFRGRKRPAVCDLPASAGPHEPPHGRPSPLVPLLNTHLTPSCFVVLCGSFEATSP